MQSSSNTYWSLLKLRLQRGGYHFHCSLMAKSTVYKLCSATIYLSQITQDFIDHPNSAAPWISTDVMKPSSDQSMPELICKKHFLIINKTADRREGLLSHMKYYKKRNLHWHFLMQLWLQNRTQENLPNTKAFLALRGNNLMGQISLPHDWSQSTKEVFISSFSIITMKNVS